MHGVALTQRLIYGRVMGNLLSRLSGKNLRLRVTLALLSALCLTALSISVITATAARAGDVSLQPDISGGTLCLAEDGSTSGPYFENCPVSLNGSVVWYWTGDAYSSPGYTGGVGELVNNHSGLCITADGDNTGLYYAKCTGNHSQEWYDQQDECDGNPYGTFSYVNEHSGYYMADDGGILQQQLAEYFVAGNAYNDCWISGP